MGAQKKKKIAGFDLPPYAGDLPEGADASWVIPAMLVFALDGVAGDACPARIIRNPAVGFDHGETVQGYILDSDNRNRVWQPMPVVREKAIAAHGMGLEEITLFRLDGGIHLFDV